MAERLVELLWLYLGYFGDEFAESGRAPRGAPVAIGAYLTTSFGTFYHE